jgi:transcriptional regulator of arginine metabolism
LKGEDGYMKNKRQEKILEIISSECIETQEALSERLKEMGFDVTQATVSRDIRELALLKVASADGRYRYAAKDGEESKSSAKFISILRETVISVESANNLVVLKTYSGMANAAAAALDVLLSEDILGSIAGDDTIFAVAHTAPIAFSIVRKIRNLIETN